MALGTRTDQEPPTVDRHAQLWRTGVLGFLGSSEANTAACRQRAGLGLDWVAPLRGVPVVECLEQGAARDERAFADLRRAAYNADEGCGETADGQDPSSRFNQENDP